MDKKHPFVWGDDPPEWFVNEIRTALKLMAQNGELVHAFDTQEFTFIQAVCPVEKSRDIAEAFGAAFLKVMADDKVAEQLPPAGALDFREITLLAIDGLNKKAARRVARLLDVAIAFGAIEHARGNGSLLNIAEVQSRALATLENVREKHERTH